MSKQRKIQKIIFCILAVILVIIFYEAIGIYTAYKKQPKVSSETKTAVQEEIKNWNQISENPERATIIEENKMQGKRLFYLLLHFTLMRAES